MIDIRSKIFNFKDKERSKISDETPSPSVVISSRVATYEAGLFAESLAVELDLINKINNLLNSPLVKRDPVKHIHLEMRPLEWLNNGAPLCILFDSEEGKPICAYFKDEEE